MPSFSYSPDTKQITVTFNGSANVATQSYVLASIPMRRSRTILDNASQFFSTTFTNPMELFSGQSKATPDEVFNGNIDLSETDVLDHEREEGDEVDDAADSRRYIRMVSATKVTGKAWLRRQWIISSIRTGKAQTK